MEREGLFHEIQDRDVSHPGGQLIGGLGAKFLLAEPDGELRRVGGLGLIHQVGQLRGQVRQVCLCRLEAVLPDAVDGLGLNDLGLKRLEIIPGLADRRGIAACEGSLEIRQNLEDVLAVPGEDVCPRGAVLQGRLPADGNDEGIIIAFISICFVCRRRPSLRKRRLHPPGFRQKDNGPRIFR